MTESMDSRHYRQSNDASVVELRDYRQSTNIPVTFHRRELDEILRLYGRKVADGEWRDYALDHLKDRAVFSVFRRTSEMPLYRIVKSPKSARKQGAYSVANTAGLILKRGHDLATVLRILEKKPRLVR